MSDYRQLQDDSKNVRVPLNAQPRRTGRADDGKAAIVNQMPPELQRFLTYPDPKKALKLGTGGLGLANQIACCLCLPYAVCCKMVLIRDGEIGLTWHGQKPEVLGPGRHYLMSITHRMHMVRNINDAVIIHGPLNIIRVKVGELGFGMDTERGCPMLLTAGKHVIDQPTFKWQGMLDLTQPVNDLGVMKLIRVETGFVGYAYRRGELVILKPGLHVIVPPDRFGAILSTQQQTLGLPEGVHESSDYVPLKIRADVFYRIVDPKKALTNVRDVTKQIRETAVSTLAGIIRSSTLNEIANSAKVTHARAKGDGKQMATAEEAPSAPPFFQHVHDKFMEGLHDYMLDGWGIELHNIRIESLKINDPGLARNVSQQAIQVSQQDARFRMLQKQAEITQVEADNRKMQRLKEMEAESAAIEAKATAQANALVTKADAEAKAIVTKAKAESTARELMGAGEKKYADSVGSSKLGAELAKLKVQADMMAGIQKVAYVPGLPNILGKTQFTTPLPRP